MESIAGTQNDSVTDAENKKLEQDYRNETGITFRDSPTALYNHGFFQIILDREIKRSDRYGASFSLAFIDIDSFAAYNARYGALKADKLLYHVGEVIASNTREIDLPARYEADLFCVIMPESKAESVAGAIVRIQEKIKTDTGGETTTSASIIEYPRDAKNKSDLIKRGRNALYKAKQGKEEKIYVFKEEEKINNHSKPVILAVDDDPRNLKLLEALLRVNHYDVLRAVNGMEALKVVDKTHVDLMLLDIMMPVMDGFEVCHNLKAKESTRMLPIVMLTALDDSESKVKCIKAGADDFITKPPNKIELIARIESLLKVRRLNNSLTTIESVLFSLANTVEAKDPYTQGHISRVSNIAALLGRKMGLSKQDIEALRYGGVLHDIGKIGVSKRILNKKGPLDEEEWEIMRSHPVIGYKICKPLKATLGPALDIIRHHHEKLDGSGYPDGLVDKDIPIVARIMSVADFYDALTSDRPYRKAMSREKALSIINEEKDAGKLDRDVVACLVDIVGDKDPILYSEQEQNME